MTFLTIVLGFGLVLAVIAIANHRRQASVWFDGPPARRKGGDAGGMTFGGGFETSGDCGGSDAGGADGGGCGAGGGD